MNCGFGSVVGAILLCGLGVSGAAAAEPPQAGVARSAAQESRRALLDEFATLLAVPNVASDMADMRRNADLIAAMLRRRGLTPQLLSAPDTSDAPPLIFAEVKVPGAKRTLVLYAHYDGQPVSTADWTTPPFTPILRTAPLNAGGKVTPLNSPDAVNPDNRLYARSAGDDKSGVMVILGALDTMRARRRRPTDNLKIVFEGEEEAGSPHLSSILQSNRHLLAADLWVICDGPVHPSGRSLITYGARGDMNVDLIVHGPNHPLHSGHYGNWAPNPAFRLARLLASMKDDAGHVTIPEWYDGVAPLGGTERRAIAEAAVFDAAIQRDLGLAARETDQSLASAATEPSLNINGLRSANVGPEAANVIPDQAMAVLDIRLVAGEDPATQFEKLARHVARQGYLVLDRAPTVDERLTYPRIATLTMRPGSYVAARAPMDDPLAHAIAEAVRGASAAPIVELPTSGGSLPLSIIAKTLGTPAIVVSIANSDDNQHAADENIRLGNLWAGIDLYAALLAHQSPEARSGAH